jgi:hypothetical protein
MMQLKVLDFPTAAFEYNYGMRALDEFDQLINKNRGLRQVRRGGHQAIEHWLLIAVLSNCYQLLKRSNIPFPVN